jgi:hypothetical protein
MKLRTILAATALGALAAPAAAGAQTPPIEGGTQVGGTVPSFLELILTQPKTGLDKFPRARTYTMKFEAQITATDAPTLLTLADGDVATGSRLGHLARGSRRLPLPLEARIGRAAFQPLDQSVDPLLARWNEAMTRQKATVNLRQKVSRRASGSYRKVLLVTLSSEMP